MKSTASKTMLQLIQFTLVGIASTTMHFMVLGILVELASFDPVLSTTVGFAVGAMISYTLNRQFTFGNEELIRHTFPKFLSSAGATGLVNGFVVMLATKQLHMHYFVAQLIASAIGLLFNFWLNRCWTFGSRSRQANVTD